MISAVADCRFDPSALPAALQLLRERRMATSASEAVLTLRGSCRLSAPLELGPEDSGINWRFDPADEAITSPAPPETFEDLADRIPDESFDSTLGA